MFYLESMILHMIENQSYRINTGGTIGECSHYGELVSSR